MASYSDISSQLGYDSLAPMYAALGGQGTPFYQANEEGGPGSYLDARMAQVYGFDPSFFDPYTFDFQQSGPGNSGTVSAFKDGNKLGSWSQYDTPFSETATDFAMTAAAAFGGLGLAGFGPMSGLSGMFGGGAGAAGGASPYALSGGSFGTSGAIGSTGLPGLGAGGMGAGAAAGGLTSTGAGLGIGSLEAALGASGIGAGVGAGVGSGSMVPAGYGISGPGLSSGLSSTPSGSMYGLEGAQFGNTANSGGLVGTGNGMGVGNYGSASSAAGFPGSATTSGGSSGLSGYVKDLLSPKGLKSTIPALTQMYSGINQRNDAKRLYGQIAGLGKPGSAYELELRKQLERRDAAAGRRSQYGPREVELQAKLAGLLSQNGGTLAGLLGQMNGGTNTALQGGLIGGSKLLDLFGG